MATVSIPASALSSGGGGCGAATGFGAGFGAGAATGFGAGFGATGGATGLSTGFFATGGGATGFGAGAVAGFAAGTIVRSSSTGTNGFGAAGFILRLVASSSAGADGFGAEGLIFRLVASSSVDAAGEGLGDAVGAVTGFAGRAVFSSSSAAAGGGGATGAESGRHSRTNAVELPIVTVCPAKSVLRSAAASGAESTSVTREDKLSMATPPPDNIRTTWRPDTSGADSFNSLEWERPMVRALSAESGKHFPAISPWVKRI